MSDVHNWPAHLVDLVEDVVAEELEDVAVAGLGPAGVARELGALVDEGEFGEEAEEAAVGELGGEGGFEVGDGAGGGR